MSDNSSETKIKKGGKTKIKPRKSKKTDIPKKTRKPKKTIIPIKSKEEDTDEDATDIDDNFDEIEDIDTNTNKKEKKNKKDEEDEEDELAETENEELVEDLETNILDDIQDEDLDFKNFETNTLFTGIIDPTKYKIFQNRSIIEERIIPPTKRKTSHILNKTEKTELIGVRAQHIAMGAEPYVVIDTETTPVEIAIKELREGKMPLLIKRKLNKYEFEVWDPNFMTIIWND